MDKKKKKEQTEYAKGVRGVGWRPLGVPSSKVHDVKTKPKRSRIKSEERRIIDENMS